MPLLDFLTDFYKFAVSSLLNIGGMCNLECGRCVHNRKLSIMMSGNMDQPYLFTILHRN